jgi:ribose transport system substrate-binding protein
MHRFERFRWTLGFAVVVACVAATSTGAAVNLPASTANNDAYTAAPAFVAPGPAFAATKARGDSIFIIPATPEANVLPSVSAMVGGIVQAATAIGVKAGSCQNSGTTAAWTACFKQAIAKKVNAIVFAGGTPPTALSAQVTAAKAAGIKLVAGHVPNPADPGFQAQAATYTADDAGLTAIVPAPYAEAARLLADQTVVDRPIPAGRFLVIGSSDIPASAGLEAVVLAELASVCGADCPVDTLDIPYSEWQTQAIPLAAAAVQAKPTVTMIPLFDKLGALLAEGIREGRVATPSATNSRMHGFGGSPFFIQLGQDNNRVEGDVAENMNWDGWATMDQTLRVLTHNAPLASEDTPLLSLSDDNWASEGMRAYGIGFPPQIDQGWGDPRSDDGWITGYRKLWGLPDTSDGPSIQPGGGGGDDD